MTEQLLNMFERRISVVEKVISRHTAHSPYVRTIRQINKRLREKLSQDLHLTPPMVLDSLKERVYAYRATSVLAPSEELASGSHQLISIA